MIAGTFAIAVAVPVVAIVAIAAVQPAPARSSPIPRTVASPVAPVITNGTMTWGGTTRTWRTFTPPIAGNVTARLPLLVLLHPAGGNINSFLSQTAMDKFATRYHFMTVTPQGLDEGTWNAGECCGQARDSRIDDVGFIHALLDRLVATTNADPGRIYVAGASNGGMLAYSLACRLADQVQAVFSAGGAMTLPDCHPSQPVTVVEFHSLLDTMVPSSGGVDRRYAALLTNFAATTDVFERWAGLDHCGARSTADAGPGEKLTVWYGCARGVLLEIWLRTDRGGHEWPTSPDAPVDASTTIAKAIASGALVRQTSASADPLQPR